jgi:hypothetical protein
MSLKDELESEIKKWTGKLDSALKSAKATDEQGKKLLLNIKAYMEDSGHFLAKDELVKSFECLIWAWALLETGKNLGHLAA